MHKIVENALCNVPVFVRPPERFKATPQVELYLTPNGRHTEPQSKAVDLLRQPPDGQERLSQKPVEPRSEKQLFRSRPLRPQNSTKTEIIAMMNPICFRNNVTARNRASHLTSCVKTTSSESLRLKPWRLRPKHRKQTP